MGSELDCTCYELRHRRNKKRYKIRHILWSSQLLYCTFFLQLSWVWESRHSGVFENVGISFGSFLKKIWLVQRKGSNIFEKKDKNTHTLQPGTSVLPRLFRIKLVELPHWYKTWNNRVSISLYFFLFLTLSHFVAGQVRSRSTFFPFSPFDPHQIG